MFKIYALKSKVDKLKEGISEIESLIQQYEYNELTAIEQIFYDRLKLPTDTSALHFFDKMDVGPRLKTAVYTPFQLEHWESYLKYAGNPDFLPSDMRAVYGYQWLRDFDQLEIRRIRNVGKKSLSELNIYLAKLDSMLNDEKSG